MSGKKKPNSPLERAKTTSVLARSPGPPCPWDEFAVCIETVVRWRDLDSYNHINNSVYLNYFEEGRIAYLYKIAELAGIMPGAANHFEGFASTLTKTEIEFKGQGFLHETIVIGVRYTAIRKIFMEAEYAIFVKSDQRLLARGKSTQVAIAGGGKDFKPVRVSEKFIKYAKKLEGDRLIVVS
jgi:acyl-CoA thioester hydrolase